MIIFQNEFKMRQQYILAFQGLGDPKERRRFALHSTIADIHRDNRIQVRAQRRSDVAQQATVHDGGSDQRRNAMESISKIGFKLILGIEFRFFPYGDQTLLNFKQKYVMPSGVQMLYSARAVS